MNATQFWHVIESACRSDPRATEQWSRRITEALLQFPADEIIGWNHLFDRFAKTAYTTDLWAAAYLINGGASDDGFYYFRCWLIGMGCEIYGRAVADPDTLADVVSRGWEAEGIDAMVESYASAHVAWMQVTGLPYEADYPARNETTELVGQEWDFDDETLMRRHLPRLAAMYLDD